MKRRPISLRIGTVSGLVVLGVLVLVIYLLIRSNSPRSITVIIGTWHWDVESNSQGAYNGLSDFWWEQVDDTHRYLVPQNGAAARLVGGTKFDAIDESFVKRQELFPGMISGSDNVGALKPGTVVVFKTAEGHYGKLQVIRYRSINDFPFPDVTQLSRPWRDLVLGTPSPLTTAPAGPPGRVIFANNPGNTSLAVKPNRNENRVLEAFSNIKQYLMRNRKRLRNFHLEVGWVLFDRESNKVSPPDAAHDRVVE